MFASLLEVVLASLVHTLWANVSVLGACNSIVVVRASLVRTLRANMNVSGTVSASLVRIAEFHGPKGRDGLHSKCVASFVPALAKYETHCYSPAFTACCYAFLWKTPLNDTTKGVGPCTFCRDVCKVGLECILCIRPVRQSPWSPDGVLQSWSNR